MINSSLLFIPIDNTHVTNTLLSLHVHKMDVRKFSLNEQEWRRRIANEMIEGDRSMDGALQQGSGKK